MAGGCLHPTPSKSSSDPSRANPPIISILQIMPRFLRSVEGDRILRSIFDRGVLVPERIAAHMEPTIIKCKECGIDVTPKQPHQLYCGRRCKDSAKRKAMSPRAKEAARVRSSRAKKKLHSGNTDVVLQAKKNAPPCPCGLCGNDPDVLMFHHRDPTTKEFSIAWALRGHVSEKRLRAEIAKCEIWCFNYHAKHHAEERRVGLKINKPSSQLNSGFKRASKSVETYRQKRFKAGGTDPQPLVQDQEIAA